MGRPIVQRADYWQEIIRLRRLKKAVEQDERHGADWSADTADAIQAVMEKLMMTEKG